MSGFSTVLHDVRYAIRTLAARPGLTLVAVLTPAPGIGANSTIFPVVNAVLLRPLPYKDPGRLMKIHSSWVRSGQTKGNLSPGDFLDFEREVASFESMAANGMVGFTILTGGDRPERLGNPLVTRGGGSHQSRRGQAESAEKTMCRMESTPRQGSTLRVDHRCPGGRRRARRLPGIGWSCQRDLPCVLCAASATLR